MADQIISRFGGSRIDFSFEGNGPPDPVLAETGETVVVYDWSDKSDNLTDNSDLYAERNSEPGWREAAGDLLANWLLGNNLAQEADHIHFIAHSFGTVVISEAIRRLGVYGIQVDQMTTLDPHDQDQIGIPDARDFPGDDPRDEPQVTVWSNVTFADNYWQDNAGTDDDHTDNELAPNHGSDQFPLNNLPDPHQLVLPVGHHLSGAANRELTSAVDFNEPGEPQNDSALFQVIEESAPHSKVHEWYYRTINGEEEAESLLFPGPYGEQDGDDWYPENSDPRAHGYALSANVGASRYGPDLETELDMTPADGCGRPIPMLEQTVFNGDFRIFEPDSVTSNLPGYDDSNNADVVSTGDSHGHAYEINFGDFSFTHRPVYFSAAAEFFSFDYNVQSAGGGDHLQVTVDGLAADLFDDNIEALAPGWSHARIPIPMELRGRYAEFDIGLVDPDVSVVNSVVWIDNLMIEQPSIGIQAGGLDFGDAADSSSGTGAGNYQTLAIDDGPSHTIDPRLFLGAFVDADDGTLQDTRANADDVANPFLSNGRILPDDEDGVLSPLDLTGTIGTQPTITLQATNTTGSTATLSGWIDYNKDGVFDNTTERAQVAVPDGTASCRFTLTFPSIPGGSAGTTYARFRLSTDVAATSPTGAANDGEVEDYVVSITAPSDNTVDSSKSIKIAHDTNGGPDLTGSDLFGNSVASVGDLDGDGVADLAVASSPRLGRFGTVHILFLNVDGSVKSSIKTDPANGGPFLSFGDGFGSSITLVGDLDGNGIADLAVGTSGDNTGGENSGAVYILLLYGDGTVKSYTKISDNLNGGPALAEFDDFGSSVASVGDLDGDGVPDLVVGASKVFAAGLNHGEVYVLLLNTNGSVKSFTTISSGTNGGPTLSNYDSFGSSVASVGDLDGDGVADLVVGASGDDTGGSLRGAVYVLLLNTNGSVKSSTKIASGENGGPVLANGDRFGRSVASVGDLDGDGVGDLGVGAPGDGTSGAVHLLLLDIDGSVKNSRKVASGTNGGPDLANGDFFGASITPMGDLDGDGLADVAVGSDHDDVGGSNSGAVHILFLNPPDVTAPSLSTFERQSPDSSQTSADILTFRVTFSEMVTGIDTRDFAVDSTTTATVSGVTFVSDSVYDVTVSGGDLVDFNGPVGLDITMSPTISDLAGNALPNTEPSTDETFTLDNAAPTITVDVVDASLNDGDTTSMVIFEFNEDVTGFDINDLIPADGMLSNFQTIDADSYKVTFTADDGIDGMGSVSVETSYTDLAGNLGTFGSDSVSIDTLNPTVIINIVDASLSDSDNSSLVTFEFSEDVTGFDIDDVMVSGGSLSPITTVDGDSFTATFTATDEIAETGSVTVGTGYTDLAGNAGAGGTDPVLIDRVAPTADIVDVTPELRIMAVGTVTVNFDEPVSGVTIDDFLLTRNNSSISLSGLPVTQVDAAQYTIDLTSVTGSLGTYVLTLAAVGSGIRDAASNALSGDATDEFTVTAPEYDFGDAPTSSTLLADDGARHLILPGFHLGAGVDFESNGQPDATATGDDLVENDDEDGIAITSSLVLGQTGTYDVIASAAGFVNAWIDGNQDGAFNLQFEFDEPVSAGINHRTITIPAGFISVGNTFVRFRLTPQPVIGALPTGLLAGGEVEDYLVTIEPMIVSITLAGSESLVVAIRDDGAAEARITDGGSSRIIPMGNPAEIGEIRIIGSGGGNQIDLSGVTKELFTNPGDVIVVVNGGDGNDTLIGSGFDDLLSGESGSDSVTGGFGDDSILGGADDDVIAGGPGTNTLTGGGGSDTLLVTGNVRLSITALTASGSGHDTHSEFEQAILEAGPGNNRLDASAADFPVTLLGLAGNDTLLGGSANDRLDGGGGRDYAEMTGMNIVLTDGSGPWNDGDTLQSIEGLQLIAAGPGSLIDATSYTLRAVTIVGSGGNDTLLGGSGNDLIMAGSGGDIVTGGEGNDTIMGGAGRDQLSGGGGNDLVFGGRGRDAIEGGLGSDVLRGGGHADTIRGGDGNDLILGGGGRDILDGDNESDTLFGGGGRDNLAGGLGADNLNGVDVDDNFNDQIRRDTLIGGLRPEGRPAPVGAEDDQESAEETPLFQNPPAYSESTEEIDEAFAEQILPELLEL